MGRLEKLKLENIKKANELLDKGHTDQYPNHEQVELKPSGNVRNSSASFLNKMNNLKEEEELGGMTSDPRIMAREYGGKYTKDAEAGAIYTKDVDTPEMSREYGERELTPAQQKLQDEVMRKIGQTFATWMSPGNPPFAQEYAQSPYFDKLSKGIRDIIIDNVE